jgi:hypothetical protein
VLFEEGRRRVVEILDDEDDVIDREHGPEAIG